MSILPSHSDKADFNGDGLTDILWHGADGTIAIWNMDATGSFYFATTIVDIPAGLTLRGYGDLHGPSMVFQEASQGIQTWNFVNNQIVAKTEGGYQPGKEIVSLGDFDGNGNIDFLFYTPPATIFGGVAGTWTAACSDGVIGDFAKTSLDYKFVGVGDFDGDKLDDLMFVGTGNGAARSFLMQELNGPTSIFSGPGPDWQVLSIADFNGDGKSDIFWQHDSGVHSIWLMDGKTQIGGGMLSIEPGREWQVIAVQDYNNDNKADIMWNNSDESLNSEWIMDGNQFAQHGATIYMPGGFWSIMG